MGIHASGSHSDKAAASPSRHLPKKTINKPTVSPLTGWSNQQKVQGAISTSGSDDRAASSAEPGLSSLPSLATPSSLLQANPRDPFVDMLTRSVGVSDEPETAALWRNLGAGEALPQHERRPFEVSYGYDFSSVKVHRGEASAKLSAELNVPAFSVANHIVLGGSIDRTSNVYSKVIGHELAHVGQRARSGSSAASTQAMGYHTPSKTSTNDGAEIEANHATECALGGKRFALRQHLRADVAGFPWLLLAGALVLAGGVAAVAPSTASNRRRHQQSPDDMLINSGWVYVPGVGSLTQVWQARSGLERGVGIGLFALDVVTFGMAGSAVFKLSAAGVRSLRAAGSGTISKLTQAGMKPMTEKAAQTHMMAQLKAGKAIIGTEGALNHAVTYVMDGAGKIVRIHGGISKLLYPAKQYSQNAFKLSMNTFTVVQSQGEKMSLLKAAALMKKSWAPTTMRSCAATQCMLLETAGLTGIKNLVPKSYSGRLLPASVTGHQAMRGVEVVSVNLPRMYRGTAIHAGLLTTPAVFGHFVGGTYSGVVGINTQYAARSRSPNPINIKEVDRLLGGNIRVILAPIPDARKKAAADFYGEVLNDAAKEKSAKVEFVITRQANDLQYMSFKKTGTHQHNYAIPDAKAVVKQVYTFVKMAAMPNQVTTYKIVAERVSNGWSFSMARQE